MIEFHDVRLALDARARLGECPLWSMTEQKLYWVDIPGRGIHRFDPASGKDESWPMPAEPGCIALTANGCLIVALRDGFYRFNPANAQLNKIADAPYDPTQFRFNDGRCDAAGRFWVGTLHEPRTAEAAEMYCLEKSKVRLGWGVAAGLGVKVSNGLAFSPDNKTVFQSDTSNHVIYQFPFDLASGTVGARREFARAADTRPAPNYGGRPDGAAIDSEGCYWSAQIDGGRVLRYSPQGEVVAIVYLPVKRVTMVAFGGPDLRTIYMTTARDGLSEADQLRYPQAGGVFACEVGVTGVAEPLYRE